MLCEAASTPLGCLRDAVCLQLNLNNCDPHVVLKGSCKMHSSPDDIPAV